MIWYFIPLAQEPVSFGTMSTPVWAERVRMIRGDGLRQEQVVCGLYVTSTQAVSRISLFSYNKNSDEYSVKINKNSDNNPWQIYIYYDE